MVTRMSKTGAIYYEEPFTQAELEERQRSEGKAEPAAKAIALERFEAGRHACAELGAMAAGTSRTRMATASLDHFGRSLRPALPVRKPSPMRPVKPIRAGEAAALQW
jgi:hypothetical protein